MDTWTEPAVILAGLLAIAVILLLRQKHLVAQHCETEEKARLEQINHFVPGVIYEYYFNFKTGQGGFSYMSPRSIEMFELEPDALLTSDQPLWAMILPDDLAQLQRSVSQAVEQREKWRDEFRITTASGCQKWIRGESLPKKATEDISTHIGIFVDISDLKHNEREQARFKAILDATSDLVGIADVEGKSLYTNPAGVDLLELTAEDLETGFNVGEFTAPRLVEKISTEAFPIAMQTGIWSGENLLISRTGREIPVSQVIIAHKTEDGTLEFLGTIIRDISDRIAAEAILQQQATALEETLRELQRTQTQMVHAEKMSSLGQLVAGIAHEINNPVNFIHGNVDYAQNYTSDLLELVRLYQKNYPEPTTEIKAKIEEIELDFLIDDLTSLMSSMKMGTERIRGIVLSLRSFSRLDESDKKAVDIHEGIESTLMILQNRIKSKPGRAEIEIIKQYVFLPLVECYPGQLNQVFMNILVNAIDALEDALKDEDFHPTISISTSLIENQRVAIAIKDNGTGIPETIQQRLFDPFFTTKPVGKGTGMGLSISYQIVTERHQGRLCCESALGQGTQFVIEIPLRPQ
jgi:PAS domain S-box-containing protein